MTLDCCSCGRTAAWPVLLALAFLAGCSAAPLRQAPEPPLPAIEIRPRPVHAGGLHRLRLRLSPQASQWRWSASAGLLHYDDLPEVEWRAPPAPGQYRVSVACETGGAPVTAALDVDVAAPSTEGMVWVPPGTFRRGDVTGTANLEEVKTLQNLSDEPSHEVYLDGYWIDRHLVTNEQYVAFLEDLLSQGLARLHEVGVFGDFEGASVPFYYFQSYERLIPHYHQVHNARRPELLGVISWDGHRLRIQPGKERHPVVDVSWFGAAAYAAFHGKQLPTEAQWEKAARGATDSRKYPWGDHLPGPYLVAMNSYRSRDLGPVGAYSPRGDSSVGMADALSGCFEWTREWFHPNTYEDHVADVPLRNPTGPFWGRAHAIRGLPYGVDYPQSVLDETEPVSFRYSWDFEFMIGDTFANRSTGFRTVLAAR